MLLVDKTKAKDQLSKLVDKYLSNRNGYLDQTYNEEQTRLEFITPFLEILGWDVSNKAGKNLSMQDVLVEMYTQKDGQKNGKPDYILRHNGVPMFALEAEKPSKNVITNREPASQVLRYGWSLNTEIGVLFNMERLEIYQTYKQPEPYKNSKSHVDAPWYTVDIVDLMGKFDEIWQMLSYESVQVGDFEKWLKEITPETALKTKLDVTFLNELDEWRVLIGQDLVDTGNDRYDDDVQLNDDVQTFLNQVIFLRFAEDNSLEQNHVVEGTFDDPAKFDAHLRQLDKKYNSQIFANSTVAKALKIDTIKSITNRLYYPQVGYDFSLIDVTILGQIYEQFLQRELVNVGGQVSLQNTKSAAVKAVVSTPTAVVKTMVELALRDKTISAKTLDELFDFTVADISVGSGVFLVAAYDYIEGRAIELIAGNSGVLSHNLISFDQKRTIIENMLFGADLDKHAVEITKFSLALRLLRGESPSRVQHIQPLIPNLSSKILNQNSLINQSDLSNMLVEKPKLMSKINASIVDINPSRAVNFQSYDIIIGNPPYMSTEQMKEYLAIEMELYKEKFGSPYKQFDKYYVFVEQTINQLKSNGKAVLLIPNKFTIVEAGTNLRKILNDERWVEQYYDFGTNQVFRGKDTYVAIVVFSKNNTKIEYQKISKVEEVGQAMKTVKYQDLTVGNGPWLLDVEPVILELYKKLIATNNKSISNFVIARNGIQTSKNNVYYFKDNRVTETDNGIEFTENNILYSVEWGLLRPAYKNNNKNSKKSKAYSKVKPDSWVIFPYENGELISEIDLKNMYPSAYEYLLVHKEELLPEGMGGKRSVQNAKAWYQYGRTQAIDADWNVRKLVVSVLANTPSVALDETGSLVSSGGTAGYVPLFEDKTSEYDLFYIMGWLNQTFVDQMFLMLSTGFRNDYWTHGTNVIDKVPLLEVDFNNSEQVALYNRIVETVSMRVNANEALQPSLDKVIETLFKELVKLRTGGVL